MTMTSRNATVAVLAVASLTSMSCARTVQDPSARGAATPQKSSRRAARGKAPKASNTEAMREVVASTYGTRQTFDRHVRNAVDAGEGDIRVRAMREALARNPDDLGARLGLAKYYKEQGFPDVALEHYRIASVRYPDNGDVAIGLGRALDALGQGVAARSGLQSFVKAHPDASADAWSWLGILQDEGRDYSGAEASHRAAIRLRENSDAFHNNLGYNLLLQGRNNEAATEFRRALTISPSSTLAKNNLATALAADPGVAYDELRGVADPATAHSNMAAILIERGDVPGARRQIEAALRYQKDHPAALSNLQLIADLEGGSVSLDGDLRSKSAWGRIADVLFGSKTSSRGNTPSSAGTGSN
jgi:Flp pilus assembly protein TadD